MHGHKSSLYQISKNNHLGHGMFGMWDVRDMGCSGCGMFGMWYGRDVGCLLGCGMLIYKMPKFLELFISPLFK